MRKVSALVSMLDSEKTSPPCVFQCPFRPGQLDLFETIGNQQGDALAYQIHRNLLPVGLTGC